MTKYSIFKCHAFKPLDYRYVSIHMHLLSLIFHKSQQKKYLPRNDPLMNYFILLLVVANNSILYLSVSSEGQKKYNTSNKTFFSVYDLTAEILIL